MSTGRRAYDLLRGYVNREFDRLQGVEHIRAEDELDWASRDPTFLATRGFTRTETSQSAPVPINPRTHASRILGVPEWASFEEIKKVYDRLNKRAAPEKFPEGSSERKQAGEIQKRIQWAFQILTDGLDSTEKRFRSLEID